MTRSKKPGVGKPSLRLLMTGLFLLVSLLYPFLIYFSVTQWDPRVLAGLLLGLFCIRVLLLRGEGATALRAFLPLFVMILPVCLLTIWQREGQWLLYYPCLVNISLLLAFAWSLRNGPPMIERFARITEPDLPERAIPYCRKVTLVWCLFFVVNASISLGTVLHGDMKIWTLYNGLLAYVFMGLLFGVEYRVRLAFKRAEGKE